MFSLSHPNIKWFFFFVLMNLAVPIVHFIFENCQQYFFAFSPSIVDTKRLIQIPIALRKFSDIKTARSINDNLLVQTKSIEQKQT